MDEREKLNEAYHHLRERERYVGEPDSFRFALSAFLSAGRSVLQFALNDLRGSTSGQAWFNEHVATIPIVRFLKEQRNLSIHEKPVVPEAKVNVAVRETIHCSEAVFIEKRDVHGNLIEQVSFNGPAPPPPAMSPPSVTRLYFFTDWEGDDDVLTLGRAYVRTLEQVVADGVARGFLMP